MYLGEFTTFFPALLNLDFVMILEIEEVIGRAIAFVSQGA
jgi:hypothetical protein